MWKSLFRYGGWICFLFVYRWFALFVTNRAKRHRPVSSSTSSFVEAAECLGLVVVVGFFLRRRRRRRQKRKRKSRTTSVRQRTSSLTNKQLLILPIPRVYPQVSSHTSQSLVDGSRDGSSQRLDALRVSRFGVDANAILRTARTNETPRELV